MFTPQELLDEELRHFGIVPENSECASQLRAVLCPGLHEGQIIATGLINLRQSSLDRLAEWKASVRLLDIGLPLGAKLADGVRSFTAFSESGYVGTLVFDAPLESELQIAKLLQLTKREFVARSDSSNKATVISKDEILTCIGRRWLRRPFPGAVASMLEQCTEVERKVAESVLEFCFHILSAQNVGGTLVLALDDNANFQNLLNSAEDLSATSLSLGRTSDFDLILKYMRHHDGAVLLSPDGRLLAGQAILPFSDTTKAICRVDKAHGTRHNSAKFFSYENCGAVCFVVSHDGPVTVYSDGWAATQMTPTARQSGDPLLDFILKRGGSGWETVIDERCAHCGKTTVSRVVGIHGWQDLETSDCLVCGTSLGQHKCTSVSELYVKKCP